MDKPIRALAAFWAVFLYAAIAAAFGSMAGVSKKATGGAGPAAWDFQYTADNGSGTDYAAVSGGTLQGTFYSTTASTDQNHTSGGSYSLAVLGANDYISFPITSGDIFNQQEGRMEIWLYYPASPTGIEPVFETATIDANNAIYSRVESDGTVYLRYEGNNIVVSMASTSILTAGWNALRFRWSVTNNLIGIKINSSAWENDADVDTVTNPTVTFTNILFGEGVASSFSDSVYIDDVTIYTTYDAAWNGE